MKTVRPFFHSLPPIVLQATLASALIAEVKIRDSRFIPDTVRVQPGDTVRWVHEDAMVHTVTAHGVWDSGEMQFGDTWSRAFAMPGKNDYVCLYHPMFGVVQVGAPTGLAPREKSDAPVPEALPPSRDLRGRVLP